MSTEFDRARSMVAEMIGAEQKTAPMAVVIEANYQETVKELAGYLLEHAPRGLSDRCKAQLTRAIDSNNDAAAEYQGNLEFRDGEDICDIYVRLQAFYPGYMVVDANGNVFRKYKVTVEVNWSSFGSASPEAAMKRLALLQVVTKFAAQTEMRFATREAYDLVATKEEREAQAEEKAKRHQRAQVEVFVAVHAKGMRLGAERTVTEDHAVPAGQYRVSNKGNHFVVTITANTGYTITRVLAPETVGA